MRLYNGTELGLPLAANDHIMVGHRKLGFHPSLYTTRGATFGNSLMFATLIQDLQHVHHLHGCPVDSHQIAAMEALVRLKLPGGSRSLEVIAGRPRVALSNTVARAGFVGDGRPGPEDWELHCLAVFRSGRKWLSPIADTAKSGHVEGRDSAAPSPRPAFSKTRSSSDSTARR
ncbi:MAG: hypothetical protein JST01_24490 [Cyanobacteria bacterium SZAS TMP-1]|nr:hypothetical protein [Cyanobacteria bacterium SZAS TMP-1]